MKTEEVIRGLLEESRNPHRIARVAGVKPSEVRKVMRTLEETLPGWGRLSIQPYIISRRHADHPYWPKEDAETIHKYRKLHDEGRVNICQGRDGTYVILYALPNRVPVKRFPYFFSGGC